MKRIALIPAYEPNNQIKDIVTELKDNNFIIIVVNDGSSNKYDEVFNSLKPLATVLSYEKNKGKGYALKQGFNYINKHYDEYLVVTLDCDKQHTINDAIKLCDYNEKHLNELVLGKRIRGKNTPLRSRLGNKITQIVYHLATGNNIYDTQTGLRSFSHKLMPFCLSINGNRYEYEMNVLLTASRENIPIKEIAIATIYFNNNANSHFNTIKDAYRIYKEIIKFSLSSIISFIIDYLFFTIFNILLNNHTIANIFARIISATSNYLLNKHFVFKDNSNTLKTALKYTTLAISILILNTLILNGLILLHINKYLAKLITEIILFFISWLVQKKHIFKRI